MPGQHMMSTDLQLAAPPSHTWMMPDVGFERGRIERGLTRLDFRMPRFTRLVCQLHPGGRPCAQAAFLGLWTEKSMRSLKSFPETRHVQLQRQYQSLLLSVWMKSLARMTPLVPSQHQTILLRILGTMPLASWTVSLLLSVALTLSGRILAAIRRSNQGSPLSTEQTVNTVGVQTLSLLLKTSSLPGRLPLNISARVLSLLPWNPA